MQFPKKIFENRFSIISADPAEYRMDLTAACIFRIVCNSLYTLN